MGWFFGFKLHLICNKCGELLNFMLTPGDIDDRKPHEYKSFVEFIYGKFVGDKGYRLSFKDYLSMAYNKAAPKPLVRAIPN